MNTRYFTAACILASAALLGLNRTAAEPATQMQTTASTATSRTTISTNAGSPSTTGQTNSGARDGHYSGRNEGQLAPKNGKNGDSTMRRDHPRHHGDSAAHHGHGKGQHSR